MKEKTIEQRLNLRGFKSSKTNSRMQGRAVIDGSGNVLGIYQALDALDALKSGELHRISNNK